MAGDWIKMRIGLAEDPNVIKMAAFLEIDEDTVVGKLHRLWGWANQHTIDGHAVSVTYVFIDRYVSHIGFTEALLNTGWLVLNDDDDKTVTFPDFDRHNGESAKKRALAAKRQRKARDDSNASSVTDCVTREEKRREENISKEGAAKLAHLHPEAHPETPKHLKNKKEALQPLRVNGFSEALWLTATELQKLQSERRWAMGRIRNLASSLLAYGEDKPKAFKAYKDHYRVLLKWDEKRTKEQGLVWSTQGPQGEGYYKTWLIEKWHKEQQESREATQ